MKKILLTIIACVSLAFMPSVKASIALPEKTDHEKVNVYLFWSSQCGHCHDFIEYFSDKFMDYQDYFEIVTYKVNDIQVNSALMAAVGEVIDETEGYIPLIVIGSEYHKVGFGTDGTEIIEEALNAYQDDNYTDLVASVIETTESQAVSATFENACKVAGVKCGVKQNTKTDGVVIGVIFGILILGFGGLVLYSRKKEIVEN